MNHIAQRPFPSTTTQRLYAVAAAGAVAVWRALQYSLNGRPARLLCLPSRRAAGAAIRRLQHVLRPAFGFAAELVVGSLWLLFLAFGLNIFASLV